MNAQRAIDNLDNAVKALENGDSNTATREVRKAMAEIRDEVCDDCEEVYEVCTCGTDPEEYDYEEDYFRDDVEADADVLRSAGMGTDEDYGYYE